VVINECKDISDNILIVTNSLNLNAATNDSNAWKKVKQALQTYYSASAGTCVGEPVFLDLANVSGGDTFDYKIVDRVIEQYVSTNFTGGEPVAVAIIGGPMVVPHAAISIPFRHFTELNTDDIYADFDHDNNFIPDTTITRLPDGGSSTLLLNFIARLAADPSPQAGSSLIVPLQKSGQRLVQAPSTTMRFITGQATKIDRCYLENYMQASTGNVDVYLAPPWSGGDSAIFNIIRPFIAANDAINQAGLANGTIRSRLTKRDTVLAGFLNVEGNSTWFARDTSGLLYLSVFGVNDVKSLPQGAHIFAMVNQSADLMSGGNQTPESSIPLAALMNNAHHFIGSLGNSSLAELNPYGLGNFIVSDQDISKYDLLLAKSYFQVQTCYRQGPAGRFLAAKIKFSQAGLNDPLSWITLHSYIYYGLPDAFGESDVNTCEILEELECKAEELQQQKPQKDCPTGNPDDCDGDGLFQTEETWVANTFKPMYYFDVDEPNFPPSFVYQVTPFPQGLPDPINLPGVILTINALYSKDVASPRITLGVITVKKMELTWHYGDNEVIEFWLSRDTSTCSGALAHSYSSRDGNVCYRLQRLVIHAHSESKVWNVWDPADGFFGYDGFGLLSTYDPSVFGSHIMVFVSRGKHAVYQDPMICEQTHYQGEACKANACIENKEICSGFVDSANAGKALFPYLEPLLNVGEKRNQLFYNMADNPLLASIFPCENVWGNNAFCGGYRTNNCMTDPQNFLRRTTIKIDLLVWDKTIELKDYIPESVPDCGGSNGSKWCGGGSSYCGGD
jgi:hypothetical protein